MLIEHRDVVVGYFVCMYVRMYLFVILTSSLYRLLLVSMFASVCVYGMTQKFLFGFQ